MSTTPLILPCVNPPGAALYRLARVYLICQGQPGMTAWRRFAALQVYMYSAG